MNERTRWRAAWSLLLIVPSCADNNLTLAGVREELPVPDTIIRLSTDALRVNHTAPELVAVFQSNNSTAPSNAISITVASDGTVWILDSLTQRLLLYTSEGVFIRSVGGVGDGPGEMRNARSIAAQGDTVYVLDRVIHVFNKDGEYVRSISPELPVLLRADAITRLTGRSYIRETFFDFGRGRRNLDTLSIREIDDSGDLGPPLVKVPVRKYMIMKNAMTSLAAMDVQPVLIGSSSGAILRSVGDSFHIAEYDSQGRPRRWVVAEVERIPTTETDHRDALAAREDAYVNHPYRSTPDIPFFRREYSSLPGVTVRPVIGAMVTSSGAEVLVQRFDLASRPYLTTDTAATAPWLVLDANMEVVASTALPLRFQPFAIDRCSALGVFWDHEDVPSIRRYRLGETGADGRCAGEQRRNSV